MRTSIATVCLSGSLTEKLAACAAAGFDGVELFEPDLLCAPQSPAEVRALADRLGLSLDLYQPFRDAEGVDDAEFARVCRRAEAKFELMQALGMSTMLVCSNVGTATVDDDDVSARQLRALGDLAAGYGVRLAYEALAWGRFVDDYRRAWRIVELADHDAVGICLDSFHILSRGHDPSAIEAIPGERIFFLQLADAPPLTMDVLSWSRHHRLFPGEGGFDLTTFVAHVIRAGYAGPLSLEVFNDVFRQTDTEQTARQALRSLRWLEDQTARALDSDPGSSAAPGVLADPAMGLRRLPGIDQPTALDFVELAAEDAGDIEAVLSRLGLEFRGHHRSKQVQWWSQGQARVVLNEQRARGESGSLAALGVQVADPAASAVRADELLATRVPRRTYAGDADLPAFAAPGGAQLYFAPSLAGAGTVWAEEFVHGTPEVGTERASENREGNGVDREPGAILAIDHVNLVRPWQHYDESVQFFQSALGLRPQASTEVAGPVGLVRSQVMRTDDGCVRLALNLLPAGASEVRQHVAFATDDIVALATRAQERGLARLAVPDNYYDDLAARLDLDPDLLATLRALDLFYDRDAAGGEFVHFYTATVGEVFFEVVQRRGGYDGYGAANAPVRLAAQVAPARRR